MTRAVSLSSACSSSLLCVDALDFQGKRRVSPHPEKEVQRILKDWGDRTQDKPWKGGRNSPFVSLHEQLESLFLWWLVRDTCYLLIVGVLGVGAAALLQLLPPVSERSIQIHKVTWKPLQRRRESAILTNGAVWWCDKPESGLPERSEVTSDLWSCCQPRREWGCCTDSSPRTRSHNQTFPQFKGDATKNTKSKQADKKRKCQLDDEDYEEC